MSRVEPCCTVSSKTTRTLQPYSPNGTQAPQSTGCTTILPTRKSVPTVVSIKDVLFRHVVFRQPLIPYFGQYLQKFTDSTTQVPSFLPSWMTGICGSNLSTCHKHLHSSQLQPDQSTSSFSPPKFRSGEPPATTQFLLSYKTRSDSHSAVREGVYKSTATSNPALLSLGEQASMEKTTQRFQRIATKLADLNAEGLNAQTVNDLFTMYVGAASQHVLRMSFVPEQEAHNFDRQVTTFWSHLIQRDVTSPLFFLLLKLGGPGVGSAFQRAPRLRDQLAQLQTTLSLQMNKPAFLLKPHGAALHLKTTQKKQVSTIQRNLHKQLFYSLTDTPDERSVLLSQSTSHTGAHLMQPSSEAYEAEDRCFRDL